MIPRNSKLRGRLAYKLVQVQVQESYRTGRSILAGRLAYARMEASPAPTACHPQPPIASATLVHGGVLRMAWQEGYSYAVGEARRPLEVGEVGQIGEVGKWQVGG